MRRLFPLIAGTTVLALAGCSGGEEAATGPGGKGGRPPAMVSAMKAEQSEFSPRLVALGTVAPLQTVAVRTRAEGEITSVAFNEGDNVRAGQLLFRLDDRLARAALAQAQAQLLTARANSLQANNDFERAEALVGKGFVTGTVLDQRRAQAAAASAAISGAEAGVSNARTQLSFLNIHAPVSGRTGELNFRLGANVRPADALPLVTINQLSPISVRFLVPPADIQQVRSAMRGKPLPVEARGDGATTASPPLARGRLVFLDNNVDPGNGSVAAKAEFLNPDDALWPGAVVSIAMPLGSPVAAVELPESALQIGRDAPFVWTIGADGKVAIRDVQVAGRADGRVYLAGGLNPGEQVVTDALARLKAGDKVRMRGGKPGAGPGAPPRTAEARPQSPAASGAASD